MGKIYKTPGVYIEEIPKIPPSVAVVESAVPVFIGYTERTGIAGTPLPNQLIGEVIVTEAKKITSLSEYETYFGRCPIQKFRVEIEEVYDQVTSILVNRSIKAKLLTPFKQSFYHNIQLYFCNGGGPCFIISVGSTEAIGITAANLLAGLEMAKRYDEPTLLVVPQAIELANISECYEIYKSALQQAAELRDRFVIIDCYGNDPISIKGDDGIGLDNLMFGAAYHPYLCSSLSYNFEGTDDGLQIELKKDFDLNGALEGSTITTPVYSTLSLDIKTMVIEELEKLKVTLPPSAAIAGVYVQVDSSRGVWKAPANVSLNEIIDVSKHYNDKEQSILNIDVIAGKSINFIRKFPGKGILVWGSRTLAGNDNEWRYISTRRFLNMVEESCKKATQQFVFEANDSNTWVKIKTMLENFFNLFWRQGALLGTKPKEAFYVSVGLNKTMTAMDILEGRLIIEIGLAVIRPAEFIIIKYSHKMMSL